MYDCSKTGDFLKAKYKMCNDTNCGDCLLGSKNNGTDLYCLPFEVKHTDKAISIVQKWADENLKERTILDDIKEKFPLLNDKRAIGCPQYFGYINSKQEECCKTTNCYGCWNQPFEGFVDNKN